MNERDRCPRLGSLNQLCGKRWRSASAAMTLAVLPIPADRMTGVRDALAGGNRIAERDDQTAINKDLSGALYAFASNLSGKRDVIAPLVGKFQCVFAATCPCTGYLSRLGGPGIDAAVLAPFAADDGVDEPPIGLDCIRSRLWHEPIASRITSVVAGQMPRIGRQSSRRICALNIRPTREQESDERQRQQDPEAPQATAVARYVNEHGPTKDTAK